MYSITTKNIIDTIQALEKKTFQSYSEPYKTSEHLELLYFPFFLDVDAAFESLNIDAEGSYTQISGVDSDFSIPFEYAGFRWVISGSVRDGTSGITKYKAL